MIRGSPTRGVVVPPPCCGCTSPLVAPGLPVCKLLKAGEVAPVPFDLMNEFGTVPGFFPPTVEWVGVQPTAAPKSTKAALVWTSRNCSQRNVRNIGIPPCPFDPSRVAPATGAAHAAAVNCLLQSGRGDSRGRWGCQSESRPHERGAMWQRVPFRRAVLEFVAPMGEHGQR